MSKHVSSSFYTIKYQSLCQSSTSPLLLIPPVVVGIDSGCFEHIVWQLRAARVSLVPHWCCRVLDRATAGEFTRWFRQNQSIPFWAVAIHEATVYSKPSAHRTRGLCWLIVVIDGFSRRSWRVTHLHLSPQLTVSDNLLALTRMRSSSAQWLCEWWFVCRELSSCAVPFDKLTGVSSEHYGFIAQRCFKLEQQHFDLHRTSVTLLSYSSACWPHWHRRDLASITLIYLQT